VLAALVVAVTLWLALGAVAGHRRCRAVLRNRSTVEATPAASVPAIVVSFSC
jgi:hypothetical protein